MHLFIYFYYCHFWSSIKLLLSDLNVKWKVVQYFCCCCFFSIPKEAKSLADGSLPVTYWSETDADQGEESIFEKPNKATLKRKRCRTGTRLWRPPPSFSCRWNIPFHPSHWPGEQPIGGAWRGWAELARGCTSPLSGSVRCFAASWAGLLQLQASRPCEGQHQLCVITPRRAIRCHIFWEVKPCQSQWEGEGKHITCSE